MGVCGSRPKVVHLDVPRQVSTTDQWLMRPTECMGGAAQVSPYAATLPAAYPYRALARVALRVGGDQATTTNPTNPTTTTTYLLAALFEAVGPAACADHCARGCRAALEAALAEGLDPPAALRRAARDLDAAFLADASLPPWLRACSGATMSAVLLPSGGPGDAGDAGDAGASASASAADRRVYAARLGAPAPLVARARGAFSNTTVECVALLGGEGPQQPKSPTRGPRAPGGVAAASPAAAAAAAAAGPPATDPHEGLTLAELLLPHAQKDKDDPRRICVRAIGLGYGKDAQLARAWREHWRKRGAGGERRRQQVVLSEEGAGGGLLLPSSENLALPEGTFIRCEPEVTAHALAPGDAAVVLASAALRAALPPAELALLAHGFDARRLSALRLAYTSGKAGQQQGPAPAAVAGWSGVDDCGGARLALAASARKGGPASTAAVAAAAAKGRGGPAATTADASSDLARLPPLSEAPAAPRGEPNAARILVHVARARLLAAANRAAGGPSAAGRPALPTLLAKRAAAQPLVADDATRLDLAADGEELALALESQRQQQQQKRKKAAATATASFDDGTDFAAAPVLAMPPGYGAVPPAGLNGTAKEVEGEEEDDQLDGAEGRQCAETDDAQAAAAACCCTKRNVHGDLAAVVLALEWGGGGGGGGSDGASQVSSAIKASTDRPIHHPATSAASLSGRAAAVQAALAAGSRSSRPAALYRWELVRLAVKARCARRRQLRAAWWAAADALRRAADAAAREAEVAAWRVLGEAVHVTRGGDVVASAAAPASAAAGGASGARAVVMLGMGGSAKGPAAAANAASAAHSLRRHYHHHHRASPSSPSSASSPSPPGGRRLR